MSNATSQQFSLYDVIRDIVKTSLIELHTCTPGEIVDYNKTTGLATVKPHLKRRFDDGTVLEMPNIYNVPVMFMRSAKASIVFEDLTKGDGVLIVFSERSLETWLNLGKECDPQDNRTHDISDAIAIPGLYAGAQQPATDQRITIKSNGDIDIGTNGLIHTLQKLVTEYFVNYVYAYHVHTGGTISNGTGELVTGAPVVIPDLKGMSLTDKVKAQ